MLIQTFECDREWAASVLEECSHLLEHCNTQKINKRPKIANIDNESIQHKYASQYDPELNAAKEIRENKKQLAYQWVEAMLDLLEGLSWSFSHNSEDQGSTTCFLFESSRHLRQEAERISALAAQATKIWSV